MRLPVLAAAVALTAAPAIAAADSFTPVVLTIKVAATGHAGTKLPITVGVSADAGALDLRSAPLRVEVKLAAECGGTFQYTPGVTLLDKRLSPQPAYGKPYSGSVSGSGVPRATGLDTVCVWLAEEGDQRVFASDQSTTVNVRTALHHKRTKRTKKGTHHR